MKHKQYTTEQIITTLRKVEVLVNEGSTVAEATLERYEEASYLRATSFFRSSSFL